MGNIIKVIYNDSDMSTVIKVNGNDFDTSRVNGRDIADWAYPFNVRKVCWNGFYDEMVQALNGNKEFEVIFLGSDEALNELKEAVEGKPVSFKSISNTEVKINYNTNSLKTEIFINGKSFDTSRIDGKEIEDWIYPFMMRKIKWDGIFDELTKIIGNDSYTINFSGDPKSYETLCEECPSGVTLCNTSNTVKEKINIQKSENTAQKNFFGNLDAFADLLNSDDEKAVEKLFEIVNNENYSEIETKQLLDELDDLSEKGTYHASYILGLGAQESVAEDEYQDIDTVSIAVDYYSKACEQCFNVNGTHIGNDDLDIMEKFALTLDEAEQFDLSYKLRKSMYNLCKKNDYVATICNIGWHYLYGLGVQQNLNQAMNYYTVAVKHESVSAYSTLGKARLWGELGDFEVKQDYDQAYQYSLIAAQNGVKTSMADVAYCYEMGFGTQKNIEEAKYWYQQAADENEFAASRLADINSSAGGFVSGAIKKTGDFIKSETGQSILKGVGSFIGAFAQGMSQASSYSSSYDDYDDYD